MKSTFFMYKVLIICFLVFFAAVAVKHSKLRCSCETPHIAYFAVGISKGCFLRRRSKAPIKKIEKRYEKSITGA